MKTSEHVGRFLLYCIFNQLHLAYQSGRYDNTTFLHQLKNLNEIHKLF